MNPGYLIKARLAASFRNCLSLFFLILAIGIGLTAAYLSHERNPEVLTAALVLEDEGVLGQRLVESLEKEDWLTIRRMEREEAMRLLKQDRLTAVIIIKNYFTTSLKKGEFANTLALYSTPSSQAAITVSEPVINKTLMLWVEEYAILRLNSDLEEKGKELTATDQALFRNDLVKMWEQGYGIHVEPVYLEEAPKEVGISERELNASVLWYAVFCLFYLIVSASWVLDINHSRLRIRAGQRGIKAWQLNLISALAPLIVSFAGFIIMGLIVCAGYGNSLSELISYSAPFLLYLIGALGILLTLASVVSGVSMLLFLAPVMTFLCAVLSAMVIPLPDWANLLVMISEVLPGRWLKETLAGQSGAYLYSVICSISWVCLGITLSTLNGKLRKKESAL